MSFMYFCFAQKTRSAETNNEVLKGRRRDYRSNVKTPKDDRSDNLICASQVHTLLYGMTVVFWEIAPTTFHYIFGRILVAEAPPVSNLRFWPTVTRRNDVWGTVVASKSFLGARLHQKRICLFQIFSPLWLNS
jgi:hypothetical protein